MNYNIEYLNVKHSLISVFMLNSDPNLLDISYTFKGSEILIQIVLLKTATLPKETTIALKKILSNFDVKILMIELTKDQFNENRGDWAPVHYKWLETVLLSKAEAL